jgi:hypothetical protein
MYRTNIVSYLPDETIEVRCWDSMTTVQFALVCLPPGMTARTHMGAMYVGCGTGWYRQGGDAPLKFGRKDNLWVLLNPEAAWVEHEYRLDAVKARDLRKRLGDAYKYLTTVKRITPDLLPQFRGMAESAFALNGSPTDVQLELWQNLLGMAPWKQYLTHRVYQNNGAILKVALPLGELPRKTTWG